MNRMRRGGLEKPDESLRRIFRGGNEQCAWAERKAAGDRRQNGKPHQKGRRRHGKEERKKQRRKLCRKQKQPRHRASSGRTFGRKPLAGNRRRHLQRSGLGNGSVVGICRRDRKGHVAFVQRQQLPDLTFAGGRRLGSRQTAGDAVEIAFTIRADMGKSPYDAFIFAVMPRAGKGYAVIRWGMDAAWLAAGALLGGVWGVGTVLALVLIGKMTEGFGKALRRFPQKRLV